MKHRTGMKSRRAAAKTASRSLSRNHFDTFMSLRQIMALAKPGSSELP
jgi:hypothetical protein